MIRRIFGLILACVLAFSAAAAEDPAEGTEKRILVIETTDVHGYIIDTSAGSEDRFQYRLARIAQLVSEARASGEYDDVLLLDGGDLYQGTPSSLMTGGAVIRAAYDVMGYDAVCLGNHEFDWSVTEYAADPEGTMAPYVLGDYFGDAKIPVLACNLYDAATGERVPFTRDYAIIEKAGLRIAVIGYIPDYRSDIMTAMIEPYRIDGRLGVLDRLVKEVNEREKPDATIVLAHEVPLKVSPGLDPDQVDLICGGHSHEILATTSKEGIPCIQGNCYGYGFASAVMTFGPDGSVRVEDLKYISVTDDRETLFDTPENAALLDPEIMAVSRAGWDAIRDEMSEALGWIDTPVLMTREMGTNSAGNWITGLFLKATKDLEPVIAFHNNGGIRTSFFIPRDETTRNITVGDIYTISPFGNSLLVYEINGQELARQLANGLKKTSYGDQMTGVTFTWTATGDDTMDRAEREYTILSATLDDGTEVDLNDTEKLYRVCVTNFSATVPGSVFEGKEPLVPMADAPVDNEAMIRVLREESLANNGYISVDERPRSVEVGAAE